MRSGVIVVLELSEEEQTQLQNNIGLLEERIAELEFQKEDLGWVRFGGESSYELSREHLSRIIARSRLFFIHNPLIRRGVSIQSDYIFAQGVNIQATDNDVNDLLQAFLDDPINKRELFGHKAMLMKEQTLLLDGNVFLVLNTDPTYGNVYLQTILVDEITDILTNPDDQNDVWFYKREWMARNVDTLVSERRTIYYPDIEHKAGNDNRRTINNVPINWDAPVIHIKTGELAKSKFGVPEVYPALDWAQAFKKFLENWSTIVQAYARFAFNLTVPGGKNAIVAAKSKLSTTVGNGSNLAEKNPGPLTGSIFTANTDGAKLDPIKTAGATTSAKDGREIKLMVSSALGIPDTMLSGDAATGNLATAQTLDRPTELKFRSRQQMWTDIFDSIFRYLIRQDVLRGNSKLKGKVNFDVNNRGKLVFKGKPGNNTHIEIQFPPILEHSISERIDAIREAVTLNGQTLFLDSPELETLTIRLMLQSLAIKDTDELVDKIMKSIVEVPNVQAQQQDTSNTDNQTGPQAPTTNGNPGAGQQSSSGSDVRV